MAPPQFDAAFVDTTNTTNVLSVTVAANSNRVLYFYIDSTATSVTRNGQSFTEITPGGGGELWRLVNPDTGTFNIVTVGSPATDIALMALSLYDADQTTPERGTVGTKSSFGAPWTSTVTSATDDLVIDLGTVSGSVFSTTESGQTERIESQLAAPSATYRALSSTRTATGTSTDLSWTGTSIGSGFLYLFAVRAAPAVAGNTPAFGRYRIAGARR